MPTRPPVRARSQHGRELAILLLLAILAGCATTTRPGTRRSSGHPLRLSTNPTTLGDSTSQPAQGYNVPGRKPDSEMPWELFLGSAAHRIIAYSYRVRHPQSRGFYNKVPIARILEETGLGNVSRLRQNEVNLRPDITDTTLRRVFEIKPWNDRGLMEGRQDVQAYLVALNRPLTPNEGFLRGVDFQGEILIRFAQGQYIWRLKWQTTEPGVVQYRWTRSQERFDSEAAAHHAGQWVELTKEEMLQYGGWVAQAIEGMVNRREQLDNFNGVVGVTIDIIGDMAVGVFSGKILAQMGSPPGARQPAMQSPSQGGAKVIPFPSQAPPAAPTVPRPAASGR